MVGGGPAGYAAALRARELGASVALIEAQHVGGHCVHFSCIPSTIMLDTARRVMETHEIALARVIADPGEASFHAAGRRKSVLVHNLAEGIKALIASRRVQLLDGRASFESATSLRVQLLDGGEEEVEAKAVVLASGARFEPNDLPGLPANEQLTPDEALSVDSPPESVLVIGGGPAGLGFAWEYASLFSTFGARVVLLEPPEGGLPEFDSMLIDVLIEGLKAGGVEVHRDAELTGAARDGASWQLEFRAGEETHSETVQAVVRPDARVPASDLPGLASLGVVGADGWVGVDAGCRTSAQGLFAAGDVTGPPLLSSVAEQQGRVAAENALGGETRVELSAVPYVLHGEPEIAAVGLSEERARAEGYDVRIGIANLAGNARAASLGRREGIVKLVADGESGDLLGMHLAAPFAAEAIAVGVLALRLGATLDDLAAAWQWHPSVAEGVALAARSASR